MSTSSTPGIPMKGDTRCPTCGFGKNRDFNFCSNPFHLAAPSEEPTPPDNPLVGSGRASYEIVDEPSSAPRAVTAGTPDSHLAILIDAVKLVGESGWDGARWNLHVSAEVANLLFDVAYLNVAEPRPFDGQKSRAIRERLARLRSPGETPEADVPKSLKDRMGALLIAIKHDAEWDKARFKPYYVEATALLHELLNGTRAGQLEAMLAQSALSRAALPSDSSPPQPTWLQCSNCMTCQSKHEKYPACANCGAVGYLVEQFTGVTVRPCSDSSPETKTDG